MTNDPGKAVRAALITARGIMRPVNHQRALDAVHDKINSVQEKQKSFYSKYSYDDEGEPAINLQKLTQDPDYLATEKEKRPLVNKYKAIVRAKESYDAKKLSNAYLSSGADNFIAGNHKSIPPLVYHGSRRNLHEFPHMAHFGTAKSAQDRLDFNGVTNKQTIYPIRLSIKSPLDVGEEDDWSNNYDTIRQISDHLRIIGKNKQANDLESIKEPDKVSRAIESSHMKRAADIIKSAGYDGISYINRNEDPGSRSFIALHPEQVKSAIGNSGAFDASNRDITKASGGSVKHELEGFEPLVDSPYERHLNPLGLYSKAAEIAHTLPQKKGSTEQFMAALKNKGVKPTELENAGQPELGKTTTNTQIGRHFDRNAPQLSVTKLGYDADSPKTLSYEEGDKMYELGALHNAGNATPEQSQEYRELTRRHNYRNQNHVPTKYHSYATPGGTKYREHLITIPTKSDNVDHDTPENWGSDYHSNDKDFHSSHWDHPNVVAHVRMQDMAGKGSLGKDDEEKLSRLGLRMSERYHDLMDLGYSDESIKKHPIFLNKQKEFDDEKERQSKMKPEKILHVDEIQSDWGQQGRENGFFGETPQKRTEADIAPVRARFAAREQELMNAGAHWNEFNQDPEYQNLGIQIERHDDAIFNSNQLGAPKGPYVQNTQHWTDLALKHVLHEAAKGDYDKVQFATGKENADRYGLAQHYSKIVHYPKSNQITFVQKGEGAHTVDFDKNGELDEDKLRQYMGRDLTEKFLSQPVVKDEFHTKRTLEGDDLSVGGEGMKQFYDQMIPKSAMKLVQQHDPDIKPEKITGKDGVDRFGFSLSDKAKASIKRGQQMFARGGAVLSESQKSAGNYKKDHINIQGLNIAIENAKGSTRSGTDKSGRKWSVSMPADYGYIKGTSGADGDHVDVYIGPNRDSDSVFVVDQKDHTTGKFDEHKVMIGFKSLDEATKAYDAGFSDGKGSARRGHMARLTMSEFKQWLKNHNTTKPLVKQSLIDKALSVTKSAQRSV